MKIVPNGLELPITYSVFEATDDERRKVIDAIVKFDLLYEDGDDWHNDPREPQLRVIASTDYQFDQFEHRLRVYIGR